MNGVASRARTTLRCTSRDGVVAEPTCGIGERQRDSEPRLRVVEDAAPAHGRDSEIVELDDDANDAHTKNLVLSLGSETQIFALAARCARAVVSIPAFEYESRCERKSSPRARNKSAVSAPRQHRQRPSLSIA